MLSEGAIIGIIIGSISGGVILIVIIVCCICKKNNSEGENNILNLLKQIGKENKDTKDINRQGIEEDEKVKNIILQNFKETNTKPSKVKSKADILSNSSSQIGNNKEENSQTNLKEKENNK